MQLGKIDSVAMRAFASGVIRARWLVVALWVAIGAGAILQARHTLDALDVRGDSDRDTEALRTDGMLRDRFARPIGEFFAVTVEGPAPFHTPRPRAVLDSLIAGMERQSYVQGTISFPATDDSLFISPDGRTTFFVVAVNVPGQDVGGIVPHARETLASTMARVPNRNSYRVLVTGRAPLDLDVREISAEDSRNGEIRLLPITLVILVLAFGALVAALLPLLVGFLAIFVALAVVGLVARVTPMSIFVLNLTTMVGLGVGIDYSLLIVTRFREELRRGIGRKDAALRTMQTAGSAVITSGLTVMVGFAALLITPLTDTRSVGIGGLIVVAVAVLLSVTLLPALLAILGKEINHPRFLAKRLAWYHSPLMWERWARTLARNPYRALLLGGLTIATLTAPLLFIRIGLPSRNWWPSHSEAGQGVEVLTRMGAGGVIMPVRILVEVPEGERAVGAARLRGVKRLSDTLKADPRIKQVRSVVDIAPNASILGLSLLYSDLDRARERYGDFVDAYLSSDSRMVLLDVIPSDTTSLTTQMDLIRSIRAMGDSGIRGLTGSDLLVGGYVASTLDFQEELLAQFPLLVLLILGATGVMLALAFKSVLVPLKAIIMNALSVGATFGLIVLVFQFGWDGGLLGIGGPTSAIFVVVPVLVFAIVFGLSMDYEVFLLSRIKEAYDRTGKNDEATMEGLSATASVITSAALIMIMVFGVFAFARVLVMQFLGFGLAVAVLLDATIVRMVLVPAFMHLMGRWNWWPGVPLRVDPAGPTVSGETVSVPPAGRVLEVGESE
jgi:RND superfamily putative drug exporter